VPLPPARALPVKAFDAPVISSQAQANLVAKDAVMLAKGKVRQQLTVSVPASAGQYSTFGASMTSQDGFDMVVSVKANSGAFISFSPAQAASTSDSWEVVIGLNGRSLIRSGGVELASYIDTVSLGPAEQWRTLYISYYGSDSKLLSVWNDVGANSDLPIMSVAVPDLSARTIYPGFASQDSTITFSVPQYVDIPRFADSTAVPIAQQAGAAQAAVPSNN